MYLFIRTFEEKSLAFARAAAAAAAPRATSYATVRSAWRRGVWFAEAHDYDGNVVGVPPAVFCAPQLAALIFDRCCRPLHRVFIIRTRDAFLEYFANLCVCVCVLLLLMMCRSEK